MNPTSTRGIKRITQTAQCCGRGYWRWRFADREFSTDVTCCHCGSQLIWKNHERTKKAKCRRRYELLRWRFQKQGLNTNGRLPQRRWKLPSDPVERKAILDEQRRAKWHRRADRFRARGLNTKGRPFKSLRKRYDIWRASLNIKPIPDFGDHTSINQLRGVEYMGWARRQKERQEAKAA